MEKLLDITESEQVTIRMLIEQCKAHGAEDFTFSRLTDDNNFKNKTAVLFRWTVDPHEVDIPVDDSEAYKVTSHNKRRLACLLDFDAWDRLYEELRAASPEVSPGNGVNPIRWASMPIANGHTAKVYVNDEAQKLLDRLMSR